MAPTVSFNSASTKSVAQGQDKDERVFTAEEMHFEGFDFVAPEKHQDTGIPQKTLQFQCKHTRDFAPVRCGPKSRKLRFEPPAKSLYTIVEISPTTQEGSQPEGGHHVECSG